MANTIVLETIPGRPKCRKVYVALPCEMPDGSVDTIPVDFITDGSSTPIGFKWLIPRNDHPIDSCKHDYRCSKAKNKEERKWADSQYRKGISGTAAPTRRERAWLKVQSVAGYVGVRIGAFFGVGSTF